MLHKTRADTSSSHEIAENRLTREIGHLQNQKVRTQACAEAQVPRVCLAIQHIIPQDCSGRRLLEYNGDTRDKAPRWTQVARDPAYLSHKDAGG